jgi:hypothetical protein
MHGFVNIKYLTGLVQASAQAIKYIAKTEYQKYVLNLVF